MERNKLFEKVKKFIPDLEVIICKQEIIKYKCGYAKKYWFNIKTLRGEYPGIFTDSICNYKNNIKSNRDDILYSWLIDAQCYEDTSNFEDFYNSFGYSEDDISLARHIYKSCKRAYDKLNELLLSEQINKLQEVFQDY